MTDVLDAGLLRAVSLSVEAQLGLHYPPERWTDLERGLRAAAADLGFACVEKCARELVLAKLGREQIDSLAVHLTTGETYFFRDPAAFEVLAAQVLPALVQERRGRARRLRVWSAGCCTGEEAYSIAIALRRAIPDLDGWQITILATDINPRFLRKASAGIYGPWSFRGVPEETRTVWFRRKEDGRFEVLPALRKMVTFACLNLVEDVYPSLANNTNAMDIIFCRNVLMYFSHEQWRKVVSKLHRSLVDGGRLIVSASEGSRELFAGFAPVEIPGVALYQKGVLAPPPVVGPLPAPLPAMDHAADARRLASEDQPADRSVRFTPEHAADAQLANEDQPADRSVRLTPDHAADARRLANEGRLTEALTACDRSLAVDKLVAAHHYLRGVILQEQNAIEDAVTALKRALYLDPDFVLAHFALGHLLLRKGRRREAARCFANAHSLVRDRTPDSVLPESDGITAGRLLAILTSMEEAIA